MLGKPTSRVFSFFRPIFHIGCLLLLGLITGCGSVGETKGSTKPTILCTTGMIADLVRNLAGDTVQIDCLMGPGVDPHRYIPTARDLDRLQSAKIIFYNGFHLEGKMTDVFERLSTQQLTVAVAEKIDWREGEKRILHDGESLPDPHIWFDVQLWAKTIPVVQTALTQVFPDHAPLFAANAEKYQAELQALDREIRLELSKIPAEARILATCHDAFAYFGKAYDFEVRGLQGISTASDSGTAEVRDLAKYLSKKRVPTIFGESSVPDKGIRAVQAAVRKDAKFDIQLSPETLYSDALGEAGSGAETYSQMVRKNVSTIVKGLLPRP